VHVNFQDQENVAGVLNPVPCILENIICRRTECKFWLKWKMKAMSVLEACYILKDLLVIC